MDYLRRAWAEVDLGNLKHNYAVMARRLEKGCRTMAIVKADAYGHGDGYVSKALEQAGADWFGVSNLNEALSLRRQGIRRPILILGFTPPEQAGLLYEMEITQSVYSGEYARALSAAAVKEGVSIGCHIKADTGMTRIGFCAGRGKEARAADEIAAACRLPGLSCTGIFTHFACADEPTPESDLYTKTQFETFTRLLSQLARLGLSFPLRHCCNSAGSLRFPHMHLDMARLGDVLYGLSPSPVCAPWCSDLRPVMSLYAIITMVKEVEEGVPVSYGRRYKTSRPGQRIASVAIGYADGYSRAFTNRGRVLVKGRFAPIAGSVCMDQLMVDVSHIPQAAMGDVVTLVGGGKDKRITFDDLAALAGTINYEEVCLIGRRVPRVYIENGQEIAAVDYVVKNF